MSCMHGHNDWATFDQRTLVNAIPQLPTDVFQSPDVQQLFQEVQSYQQHFVQLHKASTANQQQGEDPIALKARLLELENQKQQLKDKVTRAKTKVQTVPNLQSLQVTPVVLYQVILYQVMTKMAFQDACVQERLHTHVVSHRYTCTVHVYWRIGLQQKCCMSHKFMLTKVNVT